MRVLYCRNPSDRRRANEGLEGRNRNGDGGIEWNGREGRKVGKCGGGLVRICDGDGDNMI